MAPVYGIDFGTSNSAIMIGRADGRVLRVPNPFEHGFDIPSAVCMLADRTMAVGSLATRMKLSRAAWYRDEFKRDFGSPTPMLFPPEDLDDPAPGDGYTADRTTFVHGRDLRGTLRSLVLRGLT